MEPHDPPDRDRRDASHSARTPDDAHRRAAFGRRPDDVPVLPERRRRVWPWVVGVLLLLALVPLLGRSRGPEGERDVAEGGDSVTTAVAGGEVDRGARPGAVDRLGEWAAAGGDRGGAAAPEATHPYTVQGIRLLADALAERTRSAGLAEVAPRIAELRAQADRLEDRAGDAEHAEHAHAAFVGAARLIAELHDRDRAGGGELMSLAAAVRPGRPLASQGEQVRRFFRKAAEALD